MNGEVFEFLGIPFASPPVDSLRWRPPVPPDSWDEPYEALAFPPKCPQKKFDMGDTSFTLVGQEDCLYLNVWSPDTSATLPVMVFIHGGGNQQGSSGEEVGGLVLYHGKHLSGRGNVVLVTIQYRLGPLGYLVHPGLETESADGISGNYGVLDQILALQWIRDNIAFFGGDPSNVTIFGESAGGVNVGNLLTTETASGLFHRAIIQSGTPLLGDYETARQEGIDFVDSFIIDGDDTEKIANMRKVDPDSLVAGLEHPTGGGKVQLAWQPVVDGRIFRDHPSAVFMTGNFNRIPLIVGSNADEMLPQVPPTVYPFMVSAILDSLVPQELLGEALEIYPPGSTGEEARESYARILTDAQFTVTARRTARCVSLNQAEPVWRYFFTHTHSPSIPIVSDWGSYHGMELLYLFNTWEDSPLAFGPWYTPQDDSVQNQMLTYWTNFAYTGNPNGDEMTVWPEYDAVNDCYLEIRATPVGDQCGLRTAESDLWDKAGGFEGCAGSTGTGSSFGWTPAREETAIRVYPNPAMDLIHLEIDPAIKEFRVTIFNLRGEPVLSVANQRQIDMASLPPGIYAVQMESESSSARSIVILKR